MSTQQFVPANLHLTKAEIVDITRSYTEDEFSAEDLTDAQAQDFVDLYYSTLIDLAGTGENHTADTLIQVIGDWCDNLVTRIDDKRDNETGMTS
jgi:hypothetical protein